jgi:hypothetical protein
MKKIIIILILSFCSCKVQKTNEGGIKNLVYAIDNESIRITFNYIAKYSIDEKANYILNLNNNKKLNYLFKNLEEEDKIIISHILLTKILEPNKDNFTIENIQDDKGDIQSVILIYNNLKCKYVGNKLKILDNNNTDAISNYWKNKLKMK